MEKIPEAAPQPAKASEKAEKSGLSTKKLLLFGIPVFVVQLVLVYFVVTKVLAVTPGTTEHGSAGTVAEKSGKEASGPEGEKAAEPSMYVVKDVIVNPAGTNGTRFLLTTVGFELTNPEARAELETKDVQVRDVLNTILTSKDLATLSAIEQREQLRQEIAEKIRAMVHQGKLINVYFSKFIIQ